MKKGVFWGMILFLVIGLGALTLVYGGEEQVSSQTTALDGLWTGTGKIRTSSSQYLGCPTGSDLPIAFYLRDGKAKSIFQNQLDFETEVKSKGKITFKYKDIGGVDMGEGGRSSLSISFRGKLKGSSGKGQITYGKCRGKWEVQKQDTVTAKGVEFALYDDLILMLIDSEVKGALKPGEGKKFTGVDVSGDFLAAQVAGQDMDASTFLYRFEGPGKVHKLGEFDGGLDLTGGPGFSREKEISVEMREGKVCLIKDDGIKDTVSPEPGKTIEDFSACGSLLAVYEVDEYGEKTTILYHLNKDDFLFLVGIFSGKHTFF